jgi:MSHA biogenesis protein MshG
MPTFRYKARDKEGQIVEGLLDATSQGQAATKLSGVNVIPISITATHSEVTVEAWIYELGGFGKPPLGELIIFAQQMQTLIKGGVPIVRALQVVADTIKGARIRNVITDVILSLNSGNTLSKALAKYPKVFSALMIALIEVGENTGKLDAAFLQIKIYLEKELETRRRLQSAMRYPLMVMCAIVLAIGIINLIVIPSFSGFFASFGSELPLPTRFLIACSNLLVNHGVILLIGILLTAIGALVFLRSTKGKEWWSYAQLQIPWVGDILKKGTQARFCRAFAMAMVANVPLLDAFKVVAPVADNYYLTKKILAMRHFIERGESLYSAAQQSKMFPPLVLQMLAVAEETGEMADMLLDVATYYEKEIDYDIKRLADAIEPLLIIIIAAMVLVLALGVFLPMWDISTVALKKMDGI